jgi:hypothetical protein
LTDAFDARAQSRLRRMQLVAAAVFALGVAGVLAYDALGAPAVPFLVRRDAPWIVARTPIQTNGMEIDRAHPPTAFFARPFNTEARTEPVVVHVRGLREVTLFLNDRELPLAPADPSRWRHERQLDLRPFLVPGRNVLAARVRNADGNPALQLWIDGLAERIETDERWLAAWEGDPVDYAALAEDSVRHPDAGALPAPLPSAAQHALGLAVAAAVGAALFLALRRLPPDLERRVPAAATALLALFWLLFFRSVLRTPPDVGFDAAAHLAYIDWIAAKHALPHPADGAVMYHPPLYHALTAGLLAALGPLGVSRHVVVSLLPMVSGFGMALVAGAMTRALLPGSAWREAGATVAAGLLPMSLTMAASASNEAVFAFLASGALWVALRAMLRRVRARDDVSLGVWLGAAALAKYTALLWVPVTLGAVAAERAIVERARWTRVAAGAAVAVAVAVALAGWVYARNAWIAGDPLVWSLDAVPGRSWWQLPGFYTTDYFTRFGDALAAPWFSSFHSFWDSVYTTLWGDGLLSGAVGPREAARRWRTDVMAAGFLLAVPATLCLALGWLAAARAALRGPDARRRLALSVVCAVPPLFVATLASGALHYPFWSGPKAFYLLSLTPTLALLGVRGFESVDCLLAARAPLAIRAIPWAWAAAFFFAIAWSYLG